MTNLPLPKAPPQQKPVIARSVAFLRNLRRLSPSIRPSILARCRAGKFLWLKVLLGKPKYTPPVQDPWRGDRHSQCNFYHGPPPYKNGTKIGSGDVAPSFNIRCKSGLVSPNIFFWGGFQVVVFEEKGTYIFLWNQNKKKHHPVFREEVLFPPFSSHSRCNTNSMNLRALWPCDICGAKEPGMMQFPYLNEELFGTPDFSTSQGAVEKTQNHTLPILDVPGN